MDNIKNITFIEEPGGGFISLVNVARLWYESNKNSIEVINGIYGKKLDEEATEREGEEVYINTLFIQYTGTPIMDHPQSCDHPADKRVANITTQSSCTVSGIKEFKCTKCGKIVEKEILPMLPHQITWEYDNNATCLRDGSETGRCATCSRTLKRIKHGTALGHNHIWTFDNNATCLDDGTETGRCSRCNDTLRRIKAGTKLGHDWSQWITITQPTYTSAGLKRRTCSRCRDTEEEIIPMVNLNLEITTAFVDGGVNEEYYSFQFQTNFPNPDDVQWELVSGTIPNGLALSSSGVLSGTLSASGMFTFTVKATCYGRSTTKQFTVNIAKGACTVIFNPNGGSCPISSKRVAFGSTIGELPVATMEGQEFGGWFTASTGGLRVDPTYSVSSDITLYARWGQSSDVEFGEVTTQFNIQYEGDRTNYANNPYTLYHRVAGGAAGTSNLNIQTGINSSDGKNNPNMTASNKKITLYLKVTNNGDAGNFDIGFDCDSYVAGSDSVPVKRISNGVQLGSGPYFKVTVPYAHTAWVGVYSSRTQNRYVNSAVNTVSSGDSGYAFTINNIFINSGSYVILEVTFQKP